MGGWLSLAAACAVHPLTPTPVSPATRPPVVVAQATFTATATPPATETPVLPTPIPYETPSPAPAVESVLAAPAAPPSQDSGPSGAADPAPAPDTATPEPPAAAPAPVSGDVAAAEQYTIDLINAQRAAAGVPALLRDETLMGIARARVADMIARGYTGHNDPVTGAPMAREMMRAAGYTSVYLGENWYGSIKAPPGIIDVAMAWFMTDPPHARNILSPNYAAVGVGIGFNGRQWLLIQNFAGPN